METVIECKKTKDWTNSKNGSIIPIYMIGLSDGRGGQSFGKEIPIGTPVENLIIEDKGQYGLDFKLKSTGGGGFGKGGNRGGNESFALSYAKDIAVAHINHGKEFKSTEVVKVAEEFFNWLETKKK